ncbi:MAG: hypothetical protein RLZZ283_299 [Candidatus Parcubacteria bacterium]|jgi:ADP-ribose pyrophosphatase YjhB (NUDIX family)
MPHLHDKIDFVSDVYIVNGDTVLLRMHDKHHLWFPSGGHIELYEDPIEAAHREVKEEVGLDIELHGTVLNKSMPGETELLPPRFLNRHRINETHEHIAFTYFARSMSRDIVEGVEREKSAEIRWFTKSELEDATLDILPRVRFYALTALEELATK